MKIRYQATTWAIQFNVYDSKFDASLFPKSCKVFSSHMTVCKYNRTRHGLKTNTVFAQVQMDNVNKGKNEAGMKRLERFLKCYKKLYGEIKLQRSAKFQNDIDLPESLLAIVNQ